MSKPSTDELREQVRAPVLVAGDAGYDEARAVHNGMFDKHPRAVILAQQVADVIGGVNFARDAGLELAVKGGGHSAPGFGTTEGGVVIDLAQMRDVHVDPAARTARAGGGATWGDFNYATHAYGLATTGGIVSTTGIGYLTRSHGLSVDNLRSAEVVTADGQVMTASADENPDMFWALRGGGGNFGVVTNFEFGLHPVDDIYAGIFFYEIEHAADLLRFFREFIPTADESYGAFPAFQIAPPLPIVDRTRCGWRRCWHARRFRAGCRCRGRCSSPPALARRAQRDMACSDTGARRSPRRSRRADRRPVGGAKTFTSPLSAPLFFHMHGAATRVPRPRPPSRRGGRIGISTRSANERTGESAIHTAWVGTVVEAGAAPPGQRH
jgi:hypothetical protein